MKWPFQKEARRKNHLSAGEHHYPEEIDGLKL